MNRVRIHLLGGVEEIGGNKILIEGEKSNSNFFLDFGKSFSTVQKYYDFPFSYPEAITELIDIGAIPDRGDIYTRMKPKEDKASREPETDVKAAFFSHAHLDHIGYASLLNRNITLYMGECAKQILEAIKSFSVRKTIENNWFGLEIETFKTGDRVEVGSAEVEPIHVDHSIPSAYGFKIHIEGKTIAYTGDIRLHGPARGLTIDYINKLSKEELDVLITEGTRIDYSDNLEEKDVEELARRVIESTNSLVIADFSRSDYDRFRTFHSVSLRTGREIVAHPKVVKILEAINSCRTIRSRIAIEDSLWVIDDGRTRLSRGEKEIMEKYQERTVGIEEIKREPERYILVYPIYSGGDVKRIRPPAGSIYILSSSEPVDEEREISFERVMNWMEQFGVATFHIHASGHANALDLKRIIEETNPKMVIPIHTKRPRLFKKFVSSGYKWIIPTKNQIVEI